MNNKHCNLLIFVSRYCSTPVPLCTSLCGLVYSINVHIISIYISVRMKKADLKYTETGK